MIADDVKALMLIPGLSGHETRVAKAIAKRLPVPSKTDRLGNLIATFPGGTPSVMLFTHMDQPGFIVRKIEDGGLIRVHRLGGVPERALPAQSVVLTARDGTDIAGVLANKSHHATQTDEKYTVLKASGLYIDTGHAGRAEVEAAGISIGTPVTYRPNHTELAGGRIAGTSIDDRAGCAVLLDVAQQLKKRAEGASDGSADGSADGLTDGSACGPTVHMVFATQEEFNLRGAQVAARVLKPDIAIQIDLMLASDTPDMQDTGDMKLGGGPGMSLYSFHGRGTLNGVLPHPALVRLFEQTAQAENLPLQRSAQVGILTDLSYVQLTGKGVAAIDLGFPMRYSHSSLEVCQISDLEELSRLLVAAIANIKADFQLERGS